MLCSTVLGNLNDPSYELVLRRELGGVFETDELMLDWDETAARTLHAATVRGRAVELRFDTDDAGGSGDGGRLADGDVIGIDRVGAVPWVVVVRLRSTEAYLVEVDRMDPIALAHVCWEIGNMHAPLFRGASDDHTVRLLTPAMPIVDRMVAGIPGVRLTRIHVELDPAMRFTSAAADVVVGFAPDFNINIVRGDR